MTRGRFCLLTILLSLVLVSALYHPVSVYAVPASTSATSTGASINSGSASVPSSGGVFSGLDANSDPSSADCQSILGLEHPSPQLAAILKNEGFGSGTSAPSTPIVYVVPPVNIPQVQQQIFQQQQQAQQSGQQTQQLQQYSPGNTYVNSLQNSGGHQHTSTAGAPASYNAQAQAQPQYQSQSQPQPQVQQQIQPQAQGQEWPQAQQQSQAQPQLLQQPQQQQQQAQTQTQQRPTASAKRDISASSGSDSSSSSGTSSNTASIMPGSNSATCYHDVTTQGLLHCSDGTTYQSIGTALSPSFTSGSGIAPPKRQAYKNSAGLLGAQQQRQRPQKRQQCKREVMSMMKKRSSSLGTGASAFDANTAGFGAGSGFASAFGQGMDSPESASMLTSSSAFSTPPSDSTWSPSFAPANQFSTFDKYRTSGSGDGSGYHDGWYGGSSIQGGWSKFGDPVHVGGVADLGVMKYSGGGGDGVSYGADSDGGDDEAGESDYNLDSILNPNFNINLDPFTVADSGVMKHSGGSHGSSSGSGPSYDYGYDFPGSGGGGGESSDTHRGKRQAETEGKLSKYYSGKPSGSDYNGGFSGYGYGSGSGGSYRSGCGSGYGSSYKGKRQIAPPGSRGAPGTARPTVIPVPIEIDTLVYPDGTTTLLPPEDSGSPASYQ